MTNDNCMFECINTLIVILNRREKSAEGVLLLQVIIECANEQNTLQFHFDEEKFSKAFGRFLTRGGFLTPLPVLSPAIQFDVSCPHGLPPAMA